MGHLSRSESRFNVISGADREGGPGSCVQRRLLHPRITVQLGSMGNDEVLTPVTQLVLLISDHGAAHTLRTGPWFIPTVAQLLRQRSASTTLSSRATK